MKHLWNVHQRSNIGFTNGKGVFLYKRKLFLKQKFLDFNAGGAVNSLGYGNKKLQKVLYKQGNKIWHLSNYYQNKMAERLAKELYLASGFEKSFFASTGAEGVEFAIKTARKFFYSKGETEKYEIIALENSFHGRTYGALSLSFNAKYKEGFGSMLQGVTFAKPDILEIESKITSKTCAVIMEPIQGAEGINFYGFDFITNLKKLCEKHKILLILDEVQTGMGRTGKLFAFEHTAIKPDILILAKGIAGGFPFSAVLTSNKIANCITPSSHGTTYGSNLLGIAIAIEVLKQINKPEFLFNVIEASRILEEELQILKQDFPKLITKIKGFGLMRGIEFSSHLNAKDVMENLIKTQHLLTGTASYNVLRITPPLIINADEIRRGCMKIRNFLLKI